MIIRVFSWTVCKILLCWRSVNKKTTHVVAVWGSSCSWRGYFGSVARTDFPKFRLGGWPKTACVLKKHRSWWGSVTSDAGETRKSRLTKRSWLYINHQAPKHCTEVIMWILWGFIISSNTDNKCVFHSADWR